MDIAALSMALSQAQVKQQASLSVMKLAMNKDQTHMNDMMKMLDTNTKTMEMSVKPHIGGSIDIKL
ncbi:MAG: YjfB family protein [Senegalia sp. (in: firmicutes)]|uniref:YjfB family protein n=1 Tax=Senegalia sp. (in: firmicutes) TaxID=1924098 RepID=UPI003F989D3A